MRMSKYCGERNVTKVVFDVVSRKLLRSSFLIISSSDRKLRIETKGFEYDD